MQQDHRAHRSALDHLAHTAKVLRGRPLDVRARERFSQYLDLLLLWNRSQNLTGLASPSDIVRGLFEDSLLFSSLLPGPPVRMVDIGAGAGIPGIPLRIVDEGIALTLIESRRKRVSFLKTVRRELGLDVAIEEGRAEALVNQLVQQGGEFDVAVARAVGDLAHVVPVALSYLKPGGLFIASGPPTDRLPHLMSSALGEWRIVHHGGLGLKRGFFIALRPP